MSEKKYMTVGQLVDKLKWMADDLPVYMWVDGERYPVSDVDDSWVDEGGWVDINVWLLDNFDGY